jgi:hypothetical protein
MDHELADREGQSIGFRTVCDISTFGFDPTRPTVEFTVNGMKVFLSRSTQIRGGEPRSVTRVTVTSRRLVSGVVLRTFELLSEGRIERLPGDYDESQWVRDTVGTDGMITSGRQVPLRFLPPAFRDFIVPVEREHYEAAQRTVGLIRWVYGMPGRPNALDVVAREWKAAIEWHRLPYEQFKPSRPYLHRAAFADDFEIAAMQQLLQSDASEPVGRSLWLEASALRYTNPRSALVSAVAAAEVALKDALRAHGYKPKGKWPPLSELLKTQIRMLMLKATVPLGIPVLMPSSLIVAVREGADLRNALVHEGSFSLTNEQMDLLLDTVENFVWLMDFYRGYRWALQLVHAPVLAEIAKRAEFASGGDLVRAVFAAQRI